jgi:hypothetical protein
MMANTVTVLDHNRAQRLTDFFGVRVEHRRDVDPLCAEPLVAHNCLAQLARANQCHCPRSIETEDLVDLLEQSLDVVADALLAELAEVRQVLANLGGCHIDAITEFLRRNRQHTFVQQVA